MFTSFAEVLQRGTARVPDQVLFTFIERAFSVREQTDSLSYSELHARAAAIAARLQGHGVARGERVLLLYPPGLNLICALFGCFYAGATAILLPPPRAPTDAAAARLLMVFNDAGPKVVTTSGTLRETITSLLPAARYISDDALAVEAGDYRTIRIGDDDIALIQYTSGSTAQPKGVLLSHANLLHNSALIQQVFRHDKNSRGVIWLPPYHDMGLIGGILQPLFAGFPATLLSPADFLMRPARWLQLISSTRATTSGAPNFAYEVCVRKISEAQKAELDLSSWRVAFCGAEPVRAATLESFASAFQAQGFARRAFLPCYGLAEATLLVTGKKPDAPPRILAQEERVLTSCGAPPRGVQVSIVNPETTTLLPDSQCGEVWIKSPSVSRGYLNREAESRETFEARLPDGSGPFLRSSDIGLLHEGELFLAGRIKDLIICGGRKHHPEDIEYSIRNHCPGVRGCAAFGVEQDGKERLVVVGEVEREALGEDSADILRGLIRDVIATRHDVRAREIVLLRPNALPRTTSGKIQRQHCRVLFLTGAFVDGLTEGTLMS